METDTMTFGSVITYILLMLCMMLAGTAIGQIEVVHFNASFNETNSCTWVKKLSDCDVSFVDILEEPDLQAEHQIVVVPTIIVFNNKKEIKRFQANIMMVIEDNKSDVQNVIDDIIMSDF